MFPVQYFIQKEANERGIRLVVSKLPHQVKGDQKPQHFQHAISSHEFKAQHLDSVCAQAAQKATYTIVSCISPPLYVHAHSNPPSLSNPSDQTHTERNTQSEWGIYIYIYVYVSVCIYIYTRIYVHDAEHFVVHITHGAHNVHAVDK